MPATVVAITKGRYSEEVTGTFDGTDVHGTGAMNLPKGTTAQRTADPETGDLRYNTTTNEFEGYSGAVAAWGAIGGGGGATGGGLAGLGGGATGFGGAASHGATTWRAPSGCAACAAARSRRSSWDCILPASGRIWPDIRLRWRSLVSLGGTSGRNPRARLCVLQ